MKKNPIGKYLLQNWYYYVFAFGSMALSVFLDMLAPLVTLHIVPDEGQPVPPRPAAFGGIL